MSLALDTLRVALAFAKQMELERARAEIQKARDQMHRSIFDGRGQTVLELNRAIFAAKTAREEVVRELREIEGLNPTEREHVLIAPVVALLDDEIAGLRTEKARRSRAR